MEVRTYLDDGLREKRVQVGHQLAVDVGHVQVLCDHRDEAHSPVTDPQVGVAQERSYGKHRGTHEPQGIRIQPPCLMVDDM